MKTTTATQTLQQDRVEASTTAVDDDFQKADLVHRHNAKQITVQSIALADAIAKDAPDYRSPTQMRLYAMMGLCVLSEKPPPVPPSTSRAFVHRGFLTLFDP